MTGGIGYFLDSTADAASSTFAAHVNHEIVKVQRVVTRQGQQQLKSLIEAHAAATGSIKAAQVLAAWEQHLPRFWQLVPPAEAKTAVACPTAAAAAGAADLLQQTAAANGSSSSSGAGASSSDRFTGVTGGAAGVLRAPQE
jgi:glutamate synthase domain-containing protein 3